MNDQKINCQRAEVPGKKGLAGGGVEHGHKGDECCGRPLGSGESCSGRRASSPAVADSLSRGLTDPLSVPVPSNVRLCLTSLLAILSF